MERRNHILGGDVNVPQDVNLFFSASGHEESLFFEIPQYFQNEKKRRTQMVEQIKYV